MCSCVTTPITAPTFEAPSYSADELKLMGGSRARIEALFENRDSLDPIEGGWTWLPSDYRVAIIPAGQSFDCDFVGVMVSDFAQPSGAAWKVGEVKVEITKTSVTGLYTGVYRMGSKDERQATFRLSDGGNLLSMNWNAVNLLEDREATAIRTYPADSRTADEGKTSTGTGFFVSGGGLVLTAYHVVEDSSQIVVVDSSGIEHPAELLRYSKANDLAVLQTAASEREFLRLGTAGDLRVGGKIFTMGYPASGILGGEVKYSDGAVASTSGVEGEQSLFQMTIPIQPGNSGGAVVNAEGSVVGIVTSSAAILPFLRSTGSLPQNVNWAVKAEYARLLVGEMSGEDRSSQSDPVDQVRRATCLIRAK